MPCHAFCNHAHALVRAVADTHDVAGMSFAVGPIVFGVHDLALVHAVAGVSAVIVLAIAGVFAS